MSFRSIQSSLILLLLLASSLAFRIKQYPGANNLVVTTLHQIPNIEIGMVDAFNEQNIQIYIHYHGCISQCTSPANWTWSRD